MPLVLPLVPGQRTTPKAVVVKEVRRYFVTALVGSLLLTTKRCSQGLRGANVRGVAKRFELVVVDDAYARDTVTAVRTIGSNNEVREFLVIHWKCLRVY